MIALLHGAGRHLSASEVLRWWSWDPFVLLGLVLSAEMYVSGLRRLWKRAGAGQGIHKWEAACFAAGWLFLFVALVSPLDALGGILFSAHMAQHEVLMLLAAPLLVLGRPLAVFLWALPAASREAVGQWTQGPAVAAVWRGITGPLTVWVIHGVALWIWHLPALYQATLENEFVHAVQHISFFGSKPVATLRVGTGPRGIHVSPDGKRVYVALSDTARNSRSAADAIAVIDAASRKIVARHGAGSDPEQFAVSRDGGRLYASNEDAGTATVTDLKTGKVLATLIVGIEPEGVAISPDGRWVYVTAETSNTVSVIDTRRNQVVASFLVDPRPRAAAFSPDGKRAWVTAEIGGTVCMVDVARHQVVRTISIPRSKPVGVAVSPDSRWVYVANGHGHSVAVIDAVAGKVAATIPVGKRPWGIAVSKDGRKVYTANGVSNDVSVIDTRTRKVIATIPAGVGAWGVAISP